MYSTIFEKAAALGESLIVNHPFVDGNKRSGFLAIVSLVEEDGFSLTATPEATYQFTIKIAMGEAKFDNIVEWLKQNTSSL